MATSVQQVMDAIAAGVAADQSVLKSINGVFHYKISGQSWSIDLKNAPGSVKKGEPSGKADVTITLEEKDFLDLINGKANGQSLFMSGKLKIQGNMGLAMKLDKMPRAPTPAAGAAAPAAAAKPAAGGAAAAPAGGEFRAEAVFADLSKRMAANHDLIKQVGGVYQFNISKGGQSKSWLVDLKNGNGSIKQGTGTADCTITINDDDFVGMMTGKVNSQNLFMQGKLKIAGNMGVAMKLSKLQDAKASL